MDTNIATLEQRYQAAVADLAAADLEVEYSEAEARRANGLLHSAHRSRDSLRHAADRARVAIVRAQNAETIGRLARPAA